MCLFSSSKQSIAHGYTDFCLTCTGFISKYFDPSHTQVDTAECHSHCCVRLLTHGGG